MTITANPQGVLHGKFTIPADVPAGAKNVNFTGAGGTTAQASFFGQGAVIEDVRTVVNQITTTSWNVPVDPLAQTFTLTESVQADSVDLWFTVVGDTTVSVQIRETQVGMPTREVLAEGRLTPEQITHNGWTRFAFRSPARLEANTEYAIVVLCNDAVSELGIAETNKFDPTAQKWITAQPYTIGVLLSSSNASTWTAHQDKDLTFRLNCRQYTEAERLVDLGSVNLVGATDLLFLTMIDSPNSVATGELEITLPSGQIIQSADNQHVALPQATTGTLNIKARLRANATSSAAIYPGTQVISGIVDTQANYTSVAVDADATGATVRVIFDAVIPSGSGVQVFVSSANSGADLLLMPQIGIPKPLNGDLGLFEYQFELGAVMEARVRVTLKLSGTITQRPRIRNLRIVTM